MGPRQVPINATTNLLHFQISPHLVTVFAHTITVLSALPSLLAHGFS
ncbi:MAG TPA: hypothetical protein VFS89_00515 [Nitrosospira sp.]|nr:hypothetical protein [Nitrosospira sp.]